MDANHFDALTKHLATGGFSRRRLLRGLGGGLVGAALAVTRAGAAPRCKRAGQHCQTNADCCPAENGTLCTDHVCTACPSGTTLCNGQCIATACAGGQQFDLTTCACTCPTGSTLCGGTCVDTAADAQNCGSCGNACTIAGSACINGACACPLGTTYCVGTNSCAALGTDAANCGNCGHVCAAPATACVAGVCSCPAGQVPNPLTGGCCVNAPNGPCTSNADCCSNVCGILPQGQQVCFCLGSGSSCQFDAQCCFGSCVGGTCA